LRRAQIQRQLAGGVVARCSNCSADSDSKEFEIESLDLQALQIDAGGDAAYFFSLLSCCSKELDAQDLGRIAASSKDLRDACVAIARRELLQLLGAAVVQAAEAEAKCRGAAAAAAGALAFSGSSAFDSDDERHLACAKGTYKNLEKLAETGYKQVHAVAWLLRAVPVEAASDAAVERVLSMPALPEQAAVQLVTAGMRVPYAQLRSAADRMVKGVEVWVLAQQQLGVQTDIPEDAVDICRGDFSVFKRWVGCQLCCCASGA
jgi:hypothetical protein